MGGTQLISLLLMRTKTSFLNAINKRQRWMETGIYQNYSCHGNHYQNITLKSWIKIHNRGLPLAIDAIEHVTIYLIKPKLYVKIEYISSQSRTYCTCCIFVHVVVLYMLYFKMSCVYCCQLSCVYCCSLVCTVVSCLACIVVVFYALLQLSFVYCC